MNIHIKKMVMLIAVSGIVACGKPGPMDAAADQIAQVTLKTTYASPSSLSALEDRAKKDWDMDAQKLIKTCAVAALQYMKMTPDQAGKIAAQLANPGSGSGSDTTRDLATGFSNHLERCLTKPSSYDVGK